MEDGDISVYEGLVREAIQSGEAFIDVTGWTSEAVKALLRVLATTTTSSVSIKCGGKYFSFMGLSADPLLDVVAEDILRAA